LKILYISPGYYPRIGGVEYVVKSIAEKLARMGHEAIVLAGEPEISEPRDEDVNGVKVIRWPTWSPGEAYCIPRGRGALKSFVRDQVVDVDLIHIHSAHSVFTVCTGLTIAGTHKDARSVFTPHYHGGGHTVLRRLLWVPWRRRVLKLLKKVHVIHAVSEREKALLKLHYPEVGSKIVVIPNGVNEDVLSYRWQGQSSDYMVYAGRVERYKRLDLAVKVAKEMDLKLLVIGRGSYGDKLAKHAERMYRGSVELLDPQPREKYLGTTITSNIRSKPQQSRSLQHIHSKALARGVSVITTNIAELKIWYKQGVNTYFTYVEQETTIKYLLNNLNEVRASLCEYSHGFREAFSWDPLAEKYKDVLETIV